MPLGRLTSTEKAYIAGIIDGEGCIGIYRTGGGERKDAARLGLRLAVGSTNRELLEWLQETTGVGSICFHKACRSNQKDSWNWQVRGRQAVELLFSVCQYIRVKENQVVLACNFANTMGDGGRHELPNEVILERERIAVEMRRLNFRGVANAS